ELSRFLGLTGIAPGSIRIAAEERGFLGGVLAYISGHERTLLAFATHAGIAPEEIEKAKLVLAGDDWERIVTSDDECKLVYTRTQAHRKPHGRQYHADSSPRSGRQAAPRIRCLARAPQQVLSSC